MFPISNDKLYDRLKWIAMIFLPALSTFVFTASSVWGISNSEKIVGTIVAFNTFLGVLVGVSKTKYLDNQDNFDGELLVPKDDLGMPDLHAVWDTDPGVLKNKETVTLRTKVVDIEPKRPLEGR